MVKERLFLPSLTHRFHSSIVARYLDTPIPRKTTTFRFGCFGRALWTPREIVRNTSCWVEFYSLPPPSFLPRTSGQWFNNSDMQDMSTPPHRSFPSHLPRFIPYPHIRASITCRWENSTRRRIWCPTRIRCWCGLSERPAQAPRGALLLSRGTKTPTYPLCPRPRRASAALSEAS